MGGASVALGGLILLVIVAVPPAQAEVCDFSIGTDPTNLTPETFRFCVDQANDDPGINIVRGTEETPSTVTLTRRVGVTSSMTIDGPTPYTLFNATERALELLGGNTLTIAETVSIKTEGPNAYGIWAQGGSNTIDVSGDINTKDAGAYGIFAQNGTNMIDVSGNIQTESTGAYGIFALGTGSNTIGVSGDINTAGDNAHGIAANGGSNSIDVSGDINTAGFNAHGIWAAGSDNTIDVEGDINTKGHSAYGILAQNGTNVIDVSGNIKTENLTRKIHGGMADVVQAVEMS